MQLRFLALQGFLFTSLSSYLLAGELQNFAITTNQAIEMQRRLDTYQKGQIDIHDLNENASTEENRVLIGYYLLHTNGLSLRVKLAVGRSYMSFGMYPEAIKLTTEYLGVYSNDFHAWNVLGTSYLCLKSPPEAINAYTNAVRLGDKTSYIALAGAALQGDRWDIVQSIIPELVELKKSDRLSQDNKLDLAVILLSYAFKFEREDLFIKALDGVNAKQILSREDLTQLATIGCQFFKGKEIDQIRREIEAAKVKDSNSTTNAPAP